MINTRKFSPTGRRVGQSVHLEAYRTELKGMDRFVSIVNSSLVSIGREMERTVPSMKPKQLSKAAPLCGLHLRTYSGNQGP